MVIIEIIIMAPNVTCMPWNPTERRLNHMMPEVNFKLNPDMPTHTLRLEENKHSNST
jgi:hypothetical protein